MLFPSTELVIDYVGTNPGARIPGVAGAAAIADAETGPFVIFPFEFTLLNFAYLFFRINSLA